MEQFIKDVVSTLTTNHTYVLYYIMECYLYMLISLLTVMTFKIKGCCVSCVCYYKPIVISKLY